MPFAVRSAKSLRNIDISSEVYDAGSQDGVIFDKPDVEFDDCSDCRCNGNFLFSCEILSFLVLFFLFGLNILYSVIALYNTPISLIFRNCPYNYIWFYLLFSVLIVNLMNYICIKSYQVVEKQKIILLILFCNQVLNLFSSMIGNYYLQSHCFKENFRDSQIWVSCEYTIFIQQTITFTIVIPEMFILHNNYCKIIENTSRENSSETEESNSSENNSVHDDVSDNYIEQSQYEHNDKSTIENGIVNLNSTKSTNNNIELKIIHKESH